MPFQLSLLHRADAYLWKQKNTSSNNNEHQVKQPPNHVRTTSTPSRSFRGHGGGPITHWTRKWRSKSPPTSWRRYYYCGRWSKEQGAVAGRIGDLGCNLFLWEAERSRFKGELRTLQLYILCLAVAETVLINCNSHISTGLNATFRRRRCCCSSPSNANVRANK